MYRRRSNEAIANCERTAIALLREKGASPLEIRDKLQLTQRTYERRVQDLIRQSQRRTY